MMVSHSTRTLMMHRVHLIHNRNADEISDGMGLELYYN